MRNKELERYTVKAVAVTEDGRVSVPQMVGRDGKPGLSLSEIVEMFESKPFHREVAGDLLSLRWKVKSIEVVDALEEQKKEYQDFASDMYGYLYELVGGIENKELSMDVVLLNLKDLVDIANEHVNKGVANEDQVVEAADKNYEGRYEELPKEICELLEQLIGDIDNGVIEPSEIKGRLENIQFFSEVYYEYKAVNNHE